MMDGVKSSVFHFHHHPSSSNAIAHLDSPIPASSDEQTDDEQRLQGSGVVKLMPSVSVEEVQRRIGEEQADLEALRHSLLKKVDSILPRLFNSFLFYRNMGKMRTVRVTRAVIPTAIARTRILRRRRHRSGLCNHWKTRYVLACIEGEINGSPFCSR
jgi:hypothetical protein